MRHHAGGGGGPAGAYRQDTGSTAHCTTQLYRALDADPADPARPPRQDLRDALGHGQQEPGEYRAAVSPLCSTVLSQVSASQDGKLIVWDSYSTNKVPPLLDL